MELAFGARLPGPTHLQLQRLNLATTRTTKQPARTPNKGAVTTTALTRCRHGPTFMRWPCQLGPTHSKCQGPQRRGIFTTQIDGHSLRLATPPHGPRSGASPPTRTRLPPTRTRIRPGVPRLAALPARHGPTNSIRPRSPHNNDNTPRSRGYPVKILTPSRRPLQTATRSAGHSDLETQTDLSTKAATRPAV